MTTMTTIFLSHKIAMKKIYLLICLICLIKSLFSQTFINYTESSTSGKLPSNYIYKIATDSKGNIWFGTEAGITKFDGINWITYTADSGLIDNSVHAIKEDAYGNIWVGAADLNSETGGVSMFDGYKWINYDDQNDLISYYVDVIANDSNGNIYFGSSSIFYDMVFEVSEGGVTKFDGFNWTTVLKKEKFLFRGLAIDKEGSIWIGNSLIRDLFADSIPSPYISVLKIDQTDTSVYGSTDGLPGEIINSLVIDNLGNIWIATDKGVSVFDGVKWSTYTIEEGLVNSFVIDIAIDSAGNKWFGTYNGISRFDGTNWTNYTMQDGLLGNTVMTIAIDSKGNKWFGTSGGVSEMKEDNFSSTKKITETNYINLYPNPVSDNLNILLSGINIEAGISIFNLNGIEIYSANICSSHTEISMSQFPAGFYLIKVFTEDRVITKKFIKI